MDFAYSRERPDRNREPYRNRERVDKEKPREREREQREQRESRETARHDRPRERERERERGDRDKAKERERDRTREKEKPKDSSHRRSRSRDRSSHRRESRESRHSENSSSKVGTVEFGYIDSKIWLSYDRIRLRKLATYTIANDCKELCFHMIAKDRVLNVVTLIAKSGFHVTVNDRRQSQDRRNCSLSPSQIIVRRDVSL